MLPWFEANWKRLAYGAAGVAIAALIFSYYSYRRNQTEINAGQALTQVMVSDNGGELADACLKIAADYPGTRAGQRAQLAAATSLFTTGKYADAQTQFQKYLDTYPQSFFEPQAMLGVAASLDALGKTNLAFTAYQRAAGQAVNQNVVAAAKLGLARIDEAQGKLADALKLYSDVARTYPNTSTGSEAGRRALELKTKSPTTTVAPAPAVAAPFTLSH